MASDEFTFHQIVDGISALVACLRPDGAVEFVNRRVLDYFGKTLEELAGWTNSDAVHPDDLPDAIAVSSRSFQRGEPYDIALRQRRADGVYRWFHVQGLPVRDPDGRILRWCILQTDMHERKCAETALASAFGDIARPEAELRTIIDAIPQLIVALGSDGQFLSANRAVIVGCTVSSGEMFWSDETFRIFGYDRATTPAVEAILERAHPEDRARVSGANPPCNL